MIKKGLIFTNVDADNIPLTQVQEDIDTVMKDIRPRVHLMRSTAQVSFDPNAYVEYEQYNTD